MKVCTIKAIDFDGTLAKQLEPYDPTKAGPPISKSLLLVYKWLKAGERVVIFTSRVNTATHSAKEIRSARTLIATWCKYHLGRTLPITAEKHPRFEYWDNNAHRVETNTGKVLAQSH